MVVLLCVVKMSADRRQIATTRRYRDGWRRFVNIRQFTRDNIHGGVKEGDGIVGEAVCVVISVLFSCMQH